jgi:hypothetical protein
MEGVEWELYVIAAHLFFLINRHPCYWRLRARAAKSGHQSHPLLDPLRPA